MVSTPHSFIPALLLVAALLACLDIRAEDNLDPLGGLLSLMGFPIAMDPLRDSAECATGEIRADRRLICAILRVCIWWCVKTARTGGMKKGIGPKMGCGIARDDDGRQHAAGTAS